MAFQSLWGPISFMFSSLLRLSHLLEVGDMDKTFLCYVVILVFDTDVNCNIEMCPEILFRNLLWIKKQIGTVFFG